MREHGVTPLQAAKGKRPDQPAPAAARPAAQAVEQDLTDQASLAELMHLAGQKPAPPAPAGPAAAPDISPPGAEFTAPAPDVDPLPGPSSTGGKHATPSAAGQTRPDAPLTAAPWPHSQSSAQGALTLDELGAFAALKAQAKSLPRQQGRSAPTTPKPAPPDKADAHRRFIVQGAQAAAPGPAAPPAPGKQAAPAAQPTPAAPGRQTAIPAAWQEEAMDSDADLFATAVDGVRTLHGKGRDVPVPPPTRPVARPEALDDPLRDFMDGKVEFSLEFTDEYLQGHVVGLDAQVINKMRAGEFSSEAHLDLHGLNAAQAWEALVGFFRSAYHKNLRCVLVVPGRGLNSPGGSGVLRERLQTWFTQAPFKYVILAFCTALPRHGGAGALYVLMRKQKKNRGKIHWDIIPADADLLD